MWVSAADIYGNIRIVRHNIRILITTNRTKRIKQQTRAATHPCFSNKQVKVLEEGGRGGVAIPTFSLNFSKHDLPFICPQWDDVSLLNEVFGTPPKIGDCLAGSKTHKCMAPLYQYIDQILARS